MDFSEKKVSYSNFKIIKLRNQVNNRKFIVLHDKDFFHGVLKRNESLIMENNGNFTERGYSLMKLMQKEIYFIINRALN